MQTIAAFGEDAREKAPSNTVDWNLSYYNHYGK
jgi:hypothetical protein